MLKIRVKRYTRIEMVAQAIACINDAGTLRFKDSFHTLFRAFDRERYLLDQSTYQDQSIVNDFITTFGINIAIYDNWYYRPVMSDALKIRVAKYILELFDNAHPV